MRKTMLSVALALCGVLVFTNHAVSQIQPTITCQPGEWDVLSIMVMDDSLNASFHMEGQMLDGTNAYKFTTWKHTENKVDYVKAKAGHPWDIFLYDQQYIYHWITEASNGPGDWNNQYHYKKDNNGLGQPDSDYSFTWVARCAVPGSSSFWITGDPTQKHNTRFQIHDDPSNNYQNQSCAQTGETALGAAFLELKQTATDTIIDSRDGYSNPVTTLPLQYTYNCNSQNVNTCGDREVFTFAVDTTANHFDHLKHS
jgi:hypothetical protein